MSSSRRATAIAVAAVLLLLPSAWSPVRCADIDRGAAEQVVRIGVIDVGRTGAARDASDPADGAVTRGALAAVAEINAGGGIGGRPVELVRVDAPRPWRDTGTRTARLVFDADPIALVGPAEIRAAHLAAQIATRARVPIVTLAPEARLTRIGDPWIFDGTPTTAADPRGAAATNEALGYDMVWAVASAARRRGATSAGVMRGLRETCRVDARSGSFGFDEHGNRTERCDRQAQAPPGASTRATTRADRSPTGIRGGS